VGNPNIGPRTLASADDVFKRHGLAGEFGIDRSTQEAVAKLDLQFGQVAGVVPNGDVFPDVRRKGQVDVPKTLKTNAVLMDTSGLGHREEQQVELLEGSGRLSA